MDINDLRSLYTVLTFLFFVGVVWWAFSGRRKQAFDEIARQPLLDDDEPIVSSNVVAGHPDN
jgi:cytochrome c oxidase cbb3-type subunit IV